jgi:hypothetical protein
MNLKWVRFPTEPLNIQASAVVQVLSEGVLGKSIRFPPAFSEKEEKHWKTSPMILSGILFFGENAYSDCENAVVTATDGKYRQVIDVRRNRLTTMRHTPQTVCTDGRLLQILRHLFKAAIQTHFPY